MTSAPGGGTRSVGGRTILTAGVAVGACAIGVLLLLIGYERTWRLWNIPTMLPSFTDLRTITGCGLAHRLGLDPLRENPGNVWHQVVNYPRIWQVLCVLGIDPACTEYLGAALALLLVAGVLLALPRSVDRPTALFALLVVFSPAVLLGVERGNTDLLIFFLVALSVHLLNRPTRAARGTGIGTLAFAFLLKLYPAFAFPVVARERRRFVRVGAGLAVLAVAYAAISLPDLQLIWRGTTRHWFVSYGIDVVPMFVIENHGPASGGVARAVALGGVGLALALALLGFLRRATGEGEDEGRVLDGFRVGAGIYVGTFLLGSNFDYRLVFLVPALPLLVGLARSADRWTAIVAGGLLLGVVAAAWYLVGSRYLDDVVAFWIDETANWALFLGLAWLLGRTAPRWLREGAAGLLRRTPA